jgi:hypothetical protein
MVNKEKQNKTEETKLGMAEPEEQARLPLSSIKSYWSYQNVKSARNAITAAAANIETKI